MFFIRYFRLFISLLVIRVIDLPSRVRDLMRPSFYFKKLRIKKSFLNKESSSKKIIIFVIYQKNRIPFYIKNVLETLEIFNVDVHIVANRDINKNLIGYLNSKCNKLTLRENIGRDFGAYKDEYLSLNIQCYESLYLINDSVFLFKKNLRDLFELFLNSHKEWICLHENFDRHYHAQSFMVGFGPKVIHSKFFNDYWRNYTPYSSRLHSIEKGEVGLSRLLTKKGFSPYVINSIHDLRLELKKLSIKQFIEFLDKLWVRLDDPNYIKSIQTIRRAVRENYMTPTTADFLNDPFLENNKIDYYSVALISEALELLNPTHAAAQPFAFIFKRFVFKRDLYFRNSVSVSQFQESLEDLGIDNLEIEECLDEIRSKGNSSALGAWSKIKHHLGLL